MNTELMEKLITRVVDLEERIGELERGEPERLRYGFLAYNSATDTNQTGDATEILVNFDTEIFDVGGNYGAGSLFTAPTTDKYWLYTQVMHSNLGAAHTLCRSRIVTTARSYYGGYGFSGGAGTYYTTSVGVLANMTVGDTASVKTSVSNGTKVVSIFGGVMYTYFCGYRVG